MGNCCRCTTISSSRPACKAGCIVGGYHVVYSNDSVGNCGQVGEIDLAGMAINIQNNTTCGAAVIHRLIDYDKVGFETAYIIGGTLFYIFTSTSQKNKCYKVQGVTICPITGRGDMFEITICVKDLCYTVGCGNGEECNPCNGECEEITPDLSTS